MKQASKLKQTVKDLLIRQQLERLARRLRSNYGSPFIIIGMHRCGTSLVTRLLRGAGGYFGSELDPNSEAPVFVRLNHSILSCCRVSWDLVPSTFDSAVLLTNTKVLQCVLSNQHLLWSKFFQTFGKDGKEGYVLLPEEYQLPILNLKKLVTIRKSSMPKSISKGTETFWGWKDPRNTLTLPAWLTLFPKARVIHVIRNGIDSALSLWRRCQKSGEGSPHCLDLNYCFNLWERYVKEGLKWHHLSKNRYYQIRYEDLLNNPPHQIRELLSFTGQPSTKAESLIDLIDNTNRNNKHWPNYPELLQRALQSQLFRELGYAENISWLNQGLG